MTVVRSLAPDVVVARDAPRRLRWRTRSADLARRFGLVYGAGGLPSLGNLVLVSLRVAVRDTWCVRFPLTPGRQMRGAVLALCSVGRTSFVVAGTHLSTDPANGPLRPPSSPRFSPMWTNHSSSPVTSATPCSPTGASTPRRA